MAFRSRMRDVLNRDDVSDLMRKNAIAANTNPGSGTEDLLAKAANFTRQDVMMRPCPSCIAW